MKVSWNPDIKEHGVYVHYIVCDGEKLTKGWSFLHAFRSCASRLRAMPDMTADPKGKEESIFKK